MLVNEFICCRLAQSLGLPINPPVLVDVDARLLVAPKAQGKCPDFLKGGVHCGLVRYPSASIVDVGSGLLQNSANVLELHDVAIFEQLVLRGDGRQLLTYPLGVASSGASRRFAAFDYGFAFGGAPNWTSASVRGLPPPVLPIQDPWGAPYADGVLQRSMIDRLREMRPGSMEAVIEAIAPPRWGLTLDEGEAIVAMIPERAKDLVQQYDALYFPLLKAKP